MCGGSAHALGGTFFTPTVLTHLTQDMVIASEETFGPVAPLFRFDRDADVVAMSNDTILDWHPTSIPAIWPLPGKLGNARIWNGRHQHRPDLDC